MKQKYIQNNYTSLKKNKETAAVKAHSDSDQPLQKASILTAGKGGVSCPRVYLKQRDPGALLNGRQTAAETRRQSLGR